MYNRITVSDLSFPKLFVDSTSNYSQTLTPYANVTPLSGTSGASPEYPQQQRIQSRGNFSLNFCSLALACTKRTT